MSSRLSHTSLVVLRFLTQSNSPGCKAPNIVLMAFVFFLNLLCFIWSFLIGFKHWESLLHNRSQRGIHRCQFVLHMMFPIAIMSSIKNREFSISTETCTSQQLSLLVVKPMILADQVMIPLERDRGYRL